MYDEILSYLQKDFTEPIRDPLWRNIYLTESFLRLAGTPAFQQLGRIRQLGPAFHLYPGAVHTRLSHSLGVFHLARKLITTLIVLSPAEASAAAGLTLEGVKSFLAASLLHDLGHFPFTHSLKELPLTEHETLSGDLILSDPGIRILLNDDIGADAELTAAVIDHARPAAESEVLFYRRLLSGALDPDKLDYLNRDAYFCGVPYGVQDVDFIIDRLRITVFGNAGILESGTGALEHLLFSKYLMYRNIYWHRTVRSATAMMKTAVIYALESGLIRAEELYALDDESFSRLIRDRSTEDSPLHLASQLMHRELYHCLLEIPFSPDNPLHRSLVQSLGCHYRHP